MSYIYLILPIVIHMLLGIQIYLLIELMRDLNYLQTDTSADKKPAEPSELDIAMAKLNQQLSDLKKTAGRSTQA